MIKLLTRLKQNFVKLVWIKTLIDAKLISSAFARILEWAIYTVYAGVISFTIAGIKTGDWTQLMATVDLLAGWFAISVLSGVLLWFRKGDK
jgi:hypothetical protein